MLPYRATIDDSAVPKLRLEIGELLIGPSGGRRVDKADLIGLQFGMEKLEQIGPADGIDRHRAKFDLPSLRSHAVAMPADLHPDHAEARTCRAAPRHRSGQN